MSVVLGCAAIAAIAIVVVILAAVAIGAMKRSSAGHGTSGSLSASMTNIESLFQEGKGHSVEAMRAEREDERDASGDPPER